jgi:hypothetical protein
MNLNNNPTTDQLRELLRACDARAGHHVMWVDHTGEVHITPISGDDPTDFVQGHPDVRMWLREFAEGESFVGPVAADDKGWVEDLFYALTHTWPKAHARNEPVAVLDW